MIVGLSGYARVGKDATGSILCDELGFQRLAFADILRDVIYTLNPRLDDWLEVDDVKVSAPRVQDIVNAEGWERAKMIPEVRRLLQVMGTEAGRNLLGQDVWVNALFAKLDPNRDTVITDVRFPNEATRIKQEWGFVVRIERTGVGPANDHVSERALDQWGFDYRLFNDGSLLDLADGARSLVKRLAEVDQNMTPSERLPGYGSPTIRASRAGEKVDA